MSAVPIGKRAQDNDSPISAPIQSIPALATALWQTDRRQIPVSTARHLACDSLVPLYQVDDESPEKEATAAAHMVSSIAERLRRLAAAYAEWSSFDRCAYFDLYPKQAALLLRLSERVSTVHVTVYADLLLPSFRRVEQYWAEEFFPAYQSAYPFSRRSDKRSSFNEHFLEITQPKMVAYWTRLQTVVDLARSHLSDDIGFLASAGGDEERARWQRGRAKPPAPGLDSALTPPLTSLPTLTLTMTFPLPSHRQPGRLRRLRRMWRKGNWRRPPE